MAALERPPHPLVDHIITGAPLPHYVVRHCINLTYHLGYVKDLSQRRFDEYKRYIRR
jgi:hypothetical protein